MFGASSELASVMEFGFYGTFAESATYSAGRPSRLASAHILVRFLFYRVMSVRRNGIKEATRSTPRPKFWSRDQSGQEILISLESCMHTTEKHMKQTAIYTAACSSSMRVHPTLLRAEMPVLLHFSCVSLASGFRLRLHTR